MDVEDRLTVSHLESKPAVEPREVMVGGPVVVEVTNEEPPPGFTTVVGESTAACPHAANNIKTPANTPNRRIPRLRGTNSWHAAIIRHPDETQEDYGSCPSPESGLYQPL